MSPIALKKAALLTVILVVAFLIFWEIHLRSKGVDNSFDEGSALWSYHRTRVYEPFDEATTFIGSSRIKFDLDIETWESITGEKAIQLSFPGSSPLPQLYDLADDAEFRGKLVVDVTEGLFFSESPNAIERPSKGIAYYHDLTPTQKASFAINKPLESSLVFLDKDNYSINAMLDKLEIKSRPGVFMFPVFPSQFGRAKFNRQEYVTDEFVADTNLHNQVRGVWRFLGSGPKQPPISGAKLDSLLETVKIAVDKIEVRGGEIIFVRTPSSGPYWEKEQEVYPREKYWNKLLEYTMQPGIHFNDYPETDHYVCPEFSHLTPADAIDYTLHFIDQVREKTGWKFPNMKNIQ